MNKNINKEENENEKQADQITEKNKISEKEVYTQVKVHTIPESFFSKENKNVKKNKTRFFGVFVFSFGFCLMILMFFSIYYLFIDKKDENQKNKDIVYSNEENKDKKVNTENKDEQKVKEIATSTLTVDVFFATSTLDDVATSTTIVATTSPENNATSSLEKENNFVQALDSDSDGLSNYEENLLDSDSNLTDSDGDGYSDFMEVLNLYDPANKDGSIMKNPKIDRYINNSYSYTLYYPKNWTISNMAGDSSILFKASNNQFVQIIVQENKKNQSLEDWYKNQFEVDEIENEQIVEKENWKAIKNKDSLVVYLTNSQSDYFFIASYSVGIDNVLYYQNIFNMMVKSLEII